MLSRRSEVINSRREGLTLTEFNVVEGLQRRFNRDNFGDRRRSIQF